MPPIQLRASASASAALASRRSLVLTRKSSLARMRGPFEREHPITSEGATDAFSHQQRGDNQHVSKTCVARTGNARLLGRQFPTMHILGLVMSWRHYVQLCVPASEL